MEDEVKKWFDSAQEDFETAKSNLENEKLRAAGFFAQQAAEKSLKALYIKKFKELYKVHDLVILARKVGAPQEIIEICDELEPLYTATRYPDDIKNYTAADIEDLIEKSKQVIEWTKEKL